MTLAECCDDVERRSQYNALTEPIQRPTRAACPGIEKTGFNARFHGERARRMPRIKSQARPGKEATGAAETVGCQHGATRSGVRANINRSARQASDSTVTLLSRGGGDDDEYDDEAHIPERTNARRPSRAFGCNS